jgi:putative restriction endonuclease
MMRGMAERKAWTRDELILAMNLYCKLPFGQLRHGNAQVIQLAQVLERTPSSVSMKLCNFASFDPALQARGVRGLTGASRADRKIWDEFHGDWETLAAESEAMAQHHALGAPEALEPRAIEAPLRPFEGPTQTVRSVKVRLGQAFFRQTVLASYGCRCCITGNPVPELLIASHILPWGTHPEQRVNPRNGLCLARTHDAAFDAGLITLDEDWRLVLSKRLRDYLPNEAVERNFTAYEGRAIQLPEKFRPEGEFVARHRETVFSR